MPDGETRLKEKEKAQIMDGEKNKSLFTNNIIMLENCKRIQNLILGGLMRLVSQANAMCGWVCVFSHWRSGTSVLPCHPLLTHLPEVASWSDADEVESDGLTSLFEAFR